MKGEESISSAPAQSNAQRHDQTLAAASKARYAPHAAGKADYPRGLKHVAVVMDGNGRWAQQRGLSRIVGHRRGVESAKTLIDSAIKNGIAYLTLFAFSQENWRRPAGEVRGLLALFAETIGSEGGTFQKNGVRLKFVGDLQKFPKPLRAGMSSLEKITARGGRLTLTLAIGYSGQWDIAQAARRAAAAAPGGEVREEDFARYLATHPMPPPDMLIRTGGERRISNFMLWQCAYTELYFTPVLWPDFSADDFRAAVDDFYQRDRRFGLVTNVGGSDDGRDR